MIRARHLLLLALAFSSGCSNNGPPVHFVVPKGFTGEIRLILDRYAGAKIQCIDGKFTYRVPASGVLRVSSFKPFQAWHVQTAAYEGGTTIPNESETWVGPNGEQPTLGQDTTVFRGGGLSQHNDEPPVATYFVGSTLEHEEWNRQKNPFLSTTDEDGRRPGR